MGGVGWGVSCRGGWGGVRWVGHEGWGGVWWGGWVMKGWGGVCHIGVGWGGS